MRSYVLGTDVLEVLADEPGAGGLAQRAVDEGRAQLLRTQAVVEQLGTVPDRSPPYGVNGRR